MLLLTLGTGIGSAIFRHGVLLPNTELGHMEFRGMEAEHYAADSVREAQAGAPPGAGVLLVGIGEASAEGERLSRHLAVVMDNGEKQEYGPGDFMIVPPGHDAWTIGDAPCVMIDWQGVTDYAKR